MLDLIRKGATPLVAAVIAGRPGSDGFAAYLARYQGPARDQGPAPGAPRRRHAPGPLPGEALRRRHPLARQEWLELRPVHATRGTWRRGQADRRLPRHFVHPRPLRQRQCPGERPLGLEGRHRPDRRAEECGVQGLGHRRLGRAGPWTADDLAPIVNHVLDEFGPDRVVFGGDWPVCTLAATYRQWVECAPVDRRRAGLRPSRRSCSTTTRSGSIDFPESRHAHRPGPLPFSPIGPSTRGRARAGADHPHGRCASGDGMDSHGAANAWSYTQP